MGEQAAFTNRLISESSPYLRQHAHNPVDWFPWGVEALELARKLDRPIFLSVGYSACHWCHVMERESFEDPEVGRLLRDSFISIKVDREERPDLDQIYMAAVQMMTNQGGWPMSVFLTPDLRPFYGGTYFPPDERYGRPSFKRLVAAVADAWRTRREEVLKSAEQITGHLQGIGQLEPVAGKLDASLIDNATSILARVYDATDGGFGRAPKFPHPMELRLLLRAWKRLGDPEALHMAKHTLDRMALGGIYDHLGGGFHRYSTDARWLVPHFEKMSYDNSLLAVAYLEAHQATGDSFYRQVVEDTLGFVLGELTSPEGPFYSTLDADSEGVEGKFYVWSHAEIERELGAVAADPFTYVYGVSPEGNWEGTNILHRSRRLDQDARMLKTPPEQLERTLAESRAKLLSARAARIRPGLDEKVLTSWNGLMIQAFALAGQVLDRTDYIEAATRAAGFILERMKSERGLLLRTWSRGGEPRLNAYLEDYAYLVEGLITLYEATFSNRWLQEAVKLTDTMIEQFWDDNEDGFFFTGRDHEKLVARTKDSHDSSTPSANAVGAMNLLRLARLTGRRDYQDKADETLRLFRGLMESAPMVAGSMLLALDFQLGPVQEVVVVGDPASAETQGVLRAARSGFRPSKVLVHWDGKAALADLAKTIPLLAGKEPLGGVTTYICENFACKTPLIGVEAAETAFRAS